MSTKLLKDATAQDTWRELTLIESELTTWKQIIQNLGGVIETANTSLNS